MLIVDNELIEDSDVEARVIAAVREELPVSGEGCLNNEAASLQDAPLQ